MLPADVVPLPERTGTETFDTFVPHYLDQMDAILQADQCSVATSIDETFYPCIKLSHPGHDEVIVGWGTYPGRDYQLQVSQDLASGFTNLSPVIAAESSWLTYTNSGVSQTGCGYYRVLKYPRATLRNFYLQSAAKPVECLLFIKEARMECITRNIDLDETRCDWPPVEGWFRINCAPPAAPARRRPHGRRILRLIFLFR